MRVINAEDSSPEATVAAPAGDGSNAMTPRNRFASKMMQKKGLEAIIVNIICLCGKDDWSEFKREMKGSQPPSHINCNATSNVIPLQISIVPSFVSKAGKTRSL